MEKINTDFNIPYYIVEEIVDYIELTNQGYCKSMKWENIKALLRLAKINDKLSNEQVSFIIDTFNRE